MNDITVFGAGAFGTALAISLANDGRRVALISRNEAHAESMVKHRENRRRLAGQLFPENLYPSSNAANPAPVCLIALPTQKISSFLLDHAAELSGRSIVACCKGIDLTTGLGPAQLIAKACPTATSAILSGPSFAVDIASGLPTALTLATADPVDGENLQAILATSNLRLYRSTDVIGVELGGALKNVIAIAAGITVGAGLGESARAALITRGYAEMKRFSVAAGAKVETLSGLSGLGDLVLTCTSKKSRNYSYGIALGSGKRPDEGTTVEGVATAIAVSNIAKNDEIDMPLTATIADLLDKKVSVPNAIQSLMARPLKEE